MGPLNEDFPLEQIQQFQRLRFINFFTTGLPLPIPSIAITARATADGCSEARNFTCTATTVDNIFTRPTIEWRVRGNRVPSTGNPRMDSATGQLIFDDIINSNTGDYTCRADITIPAADINSHINETTTTVSTDSKPIACN